LKVGGQLRLPWRYCWPGNESLFFVRHFSQHSEPVCSWYCRYGAQWSAGDLIHPSTRTTRYPYTTPWWTASTSNPEPKPLRVRILLSHASWMPPQASTLVLIKNKTRQWSQVPSAGAASSMVAANHLLNSHFTKTWPGAKFAMWAKKLA